jgi:hypothetical protein
MTMQARYFTDMQTTNSNASEFTACPARSSR